MNEWEVEAGGSARPGVDWTDVLLPDWVSGWNDVPPERADSVSAVLRDLLGDAGVWLAQNVLPKQMIEAIFEAIYWPASSWSPTTPAYLALVVGVVGLILGVSGSYFWRRLLGLLGR